MQTENGKSGSAYVEAVEVGDAHASGVSWGAAIAGAAAAAAIGLTLLMLGLGLGLSSVSPWSYHSSAIGGAAIAWLIFMQIVASGLGGYLAGRLRVKWARIRNDEVHFRDTAHGLLAWALATILTVGLLAGGAKTILGEAAHGGGNESAAGSVKYYSGMLLRSSQTSQNGDSGAQEAEVDRTFAVDLAAGTLPQDDLTYLGQVVANRTGTNQADAERRVKDVFGSALAHIKDAAEKSRKAAAHSAIWMFIALLIGAFVASCAATLGGRQRDHERIYLPG